MERIVKSVFSEVATKDDGSFEGYGSVFNGRDSAGDRILPGAYAKSLSQYGVPKLFSNHDWAVPIGRFDNVAEDAKGLLVTGKLNLNQSLARDVHEAMKAGDLSGLSVGGFVAKSDTVSTADGRDIVNWTRLVEISLVSIPADDSARITAVKSFDGIETIRDLESYLRETGLSRSSVQALIAKSRDLFHREAEDEKVNALAARIGAMLA